MQGDVTAITVSDRGLAQTFQPSPHALLDLHRRENSPFLHGFATSDAFQQTHPTLEHLKFQHLPDRRWAFALVMSIGYGPAAPRAAQWPTLESRNEPVRQDTKVSHGTAQV
jgi:hypothetical protein